MDGMTHGGPRPNAGRKPTGKPRKQRLNISLSTEALSELERQATAAGRSQSEQVETLIMQQKRSK
jgi:hypothetical protein